MNIEILKEYSDIDRRGRRRKYIECKCYCGKIFNTRKDAYNSGELRSCGCLMDSIRKIPKRRSKTFGVENSEAERHAYFEMLSRCFNDKNSSYKYYGKRGITVCARWIESFANFIEDVGMRPTPRHSLDRIDVDGNYEKENCKWSTQSEQCRNRRNNRYVLYNGKDVLVVELAYMFDMDYKVLHRRITRGWMKILHVLFADLKQFII